MKLNSSDVIKKILSQKYSVAMDAFNSQSNLYRKMSIVSIIHRGAYIYASQYNRMNDFELIHNMCNYFTIEMVKLHIKNGDQYTLGSIHSIFNFIFVQLVFFIRDNNDVLQYLEIESKKDSSQIGKKLVSTANIIEVKLRNGYKYLIGLCRPRWKASTLDEKTIQDNHIQAK